MDKYADLMAVDILMDADGIESAVLSMELRIGDEIRVATEEAAGGVCVCRVVGFEPGKSGRRVLVTVVGDQSDAPYHLEKRDTVAIWIEEPNA